MKENSKANYIAERFWLEFDRELNPDDSRYQTYQKFVLQIIGAMSIDHQSNSQDFEDTLDNNSSYTSNSIDSISTKITGIVSDCLKFIGDNDLLNKQTQSLIESDIGIFYKMYQKIKILNDEEILAIFDIGYYRMVGKTKIKRLSEVALCKMASLLLPQKTNNIIDAFGHCGEFAIQSFNANRKINNVWFPYIPKQEFYLKLRLAAHGINSTSWHFGKNEESETHIDYDVSFSDSEKLIDRYIDTHSGVLNNKIGIEYAPEVEKAKLIKLYAASNAESTGIGKNKEFREYMINKYDLLYSIELPEFSNTKKASGMSIWGFSYPGFFNERDGAVFANINSLRHLFNLDDYDDAFKFSANALNKSINPKFAYAEWDFSNIDNIFSKIFRREFFNGYKDLAGFCKEIQKHQIQENVSSLWPSSYSPIKKNAQWELGADYSKAESVISNHSGKGKCVLYIIGNNGQGKSVFLKKLIHTMTKPYKRVIAVTNSSCHRFPAKKDQPHQRYVLLDHDIPARFSPKSLSFKASQLAMETFLKPDETSRSSILQEIFESIDFDLKMYLIHDLSQITSINDDNLLSDIIAIPPENNSDRETLKIASKSNSHFDLRITQLKKSHTDTISFSELSSGEQNIIIMILKIMANIEMNSLVLIDEPEISLHISWQKSLPEIFEKLAIEFESTIIVATHSPVIISEASALTDHCFSLQDFEAKKIDKRNQHSVERLVFEDFKVYTKNNRELSEECTKIIRNVIESVNVGELSESSFKEAISELEEMKDIVKKSTSSNTEKINSSQNDINYIVQAISTVKQIHEASLGLENND